MSRPSYRVTDLRTPEPTPTEDIAVSHAETPTDPIPADDQPHAYVVVQRTHSVNADRPEWAAAAYVISEHDHDEIAFARARGRTLIPIGPDGDTGTRAIVELRVIAAPTSAEEFTAQRASLDATPTGSIARTEDLGRTDLWIKAGSTSWEEVRTGHVWTSHELLKRCPVTLIYTPVAVSS